MKKNDLYKTDLGIFRILDVQDDKVFCINCSHITMPTWKTISLFGNAVQIDTLDEIKVCVSDDELDAIRRSIMYKRFTVIAGIIPFVADDIERNKQMCAAVKEYGVSRQTVRKYLCDYLAFQDIHILAPSKKNIENVLSKDEKNMRWSLNKYFYNYQKNTLRTAYTMMLKEKYCDEQGLLLEEYPSFHQYRYFYRKTKKLQNFYISRNGLTDYQRNNRPCVGDGVRTYAPSVGTGMVDSTVCDIYLVNDSGQVVGRPILTVCVDAYSGLCCGYYLGWEGGMYSLVHMCLNVITDKVEYCRKHGIEINIEDWNCSSMPAKIDADQGSEYASYTFEQLSELGITITNLPPYRPELKGPVEKFFDAIQALYKKYLKGKGVIEPDFQERGAHDYRKDACLTLEMFEEILLKCIVYYNSKHVIERFPFTVEMMEKGIRPFANCIWNYSIKKSDSNLITVTKEQLTLCLLPRTTGKFSRFGLKVNKLRYHNPAYKEQYLLGGEAIVAYDPDSSSYVWLIEKGEYIRFELVESRYADMDLISVMDMQQKQRDIVAHEERTQLQADIDLATSIQLIADRAKLNTDNMLKDIGETRKTENIKKHVSYVRKAGLNGEY